MGPLAEEFHALDRVGRCGQRPLDPVELDPLGGQSAGPPAGQQPERHAHDESAEADGVTRPAGARAAEQGAIIEHGESSTIADPCVHLHSGSHHQKSEYLRSAIVPQFWDNTMVHFISDTTDVQEIPRGARRGADRPRAEPPHLAAVPDLGSTGCRSPARLRPPAAGTSLPEPTSS